MAVAQTVSGTATTTGCSSGGTITATQTGLGATPQYQLLLAGTVVAPVAGDATQFTNSNVFTSLISGSYTLKGRASAAGTVYTSSAITVANGYTAMNVVTPTKTTPCATGTVALVTTVTGGKANYVYSIASQSAPGTALQTSTATSALTFTFNALPVGAYIVSVTDNCGATVTSATSITQSGATINQIFPQSFVIGRSVAGDCSNKIIIRAKDNFAYVGQTVVMSSTDKANFSWRLEFNGLSYGQDTNADGNPDLGGADFPLTTYLTTLPGGITDISAALAGGAKMVIYDKCGNSKKFTPVTTGVSLTANTCGSNGTMILNEGGGIGTYSMACYPLNFVFTSAGHPTINYSLTSAYATVSGFVPGATYSVTYSDAIGTTTNLSTNATVSFPSATNTVGIAGAPRRVGLFYNQGLVYLQSTINNPGDVISVKVLSTDVPSMAGYTWTYNVTSTAAIGIDVPAVSSPYWPAGNYTLQLTTGCGTQNINYTVFGYKGVLSSLSTSPVCGGFNVTANTTLVEDPTYYEIVIVSGPSNVGDVRALVDVNTSQPFNGLAYGTYVFGIRPKSGNVFNTVSVTYSAANAITVDKANTGGFVCSAGATNGVLTITAASNSPSPGNVLQYALSTDGGGTYGAYQSGNTFSGLTNTTYFFKVKDACGNEITSSAQISVAAAPTATANGLPSTAQVCKTAGGTMALNVDAVGTGVTYTWSGPGISSTVGDPAYKGLKNPVISLDGLTAGAQSYSVSVLNPACSATATVSNLSVNINALPTASISYPVGICQSDAAKSVTLTGQTGGTYTALPAGLTIDATSGAITPSSSTTGTYTVTYTFTNGTCPNTATASVTINALPTATIAYPATPYYATGTAAVVQTGQGAGTYTSSPAGLSINASTGLVDLGASTVGTYTVTYTFSNGTCSSTTTAPIKILSPSVTGTPATTGCKSGGSITAVPTGLGGTPQYQLLKGGVVLAPVAGDATQYTNTALFTGLLSGTDYVIKAKSAPTATVYSSANITVTNGYTDMAVSTPTKVLTCVGGTTTLTTTVTGGKSTYIYSIALQSSPGTAIETSASTSATSYTFGSSTPLPVGTYLVSVTDACGITVTGATSISNPTVGLADIAASTAYPNRGANCSNPIQLSVESGFRYVSPVQNLSAADAALFTWKYKYLGQLYGQDTNSDGYPDINGPGFPLTTTSPRFPLGATRAAIVADIPNMRVVIYDACGNTKESLLRNYNTTVSSISATNCSGNPILLSQINAGLDCLPVHLTFTRSNNPAEIYTYDVTSYNQTFTLPLVAGGTYNITYIDNEGFTTGLYAPTSNTITVPATPTINVSQNLFGTQENLNALNYGLLRIAVSPYNVGDIITYTVTASNNPLVPVGTNGSATLDGLGYTFLPKVNSSDPNGYWPKGNYTISVSSGCGVKSTNVVVAGFKASLTGNTLTPVCGGFNYVLNGVFDVPSAYQVKIAAGSASNVGQTRDLASTTASNSFDGLTNGNYTFQVFIKGGTTAVLTQTVNLSSANVLSVDKSNTGGYVCTSGASNGTLTIAASTLSPAPGNTLTYALGTSTGAPYGAFQSANTFTGLSAGTYFFQVKDGCGNVITSSAQIGVAAAPSISIDGGSNPATTCNTGTGTMQLDVDVLGASSYLWTGPGITVANRNLKNPVINKSSLGVGPNNYTCQIVLGAPCNTTTTATAVINVNSLPTVVTVAPSAPCFPGTVDLTAPAVTAGSSSGLTYSYYTDATGTNVLTNANAVATSGTYYIKGSNGTCSDIKPIMVTINPLPVASISYASGPYCRRGTATVTQTGQAGGTYSSDAGLSISASTGAIDLSNSTVGTHTITYSFANGTCSSTTANTITINANKLPTTLADISAVCSATRAAPTLTDPCSGGLTATTATAFPITAAGTTVVTWTFDYGNGYTQTVNQNVIITLPATPTITPSGTTTFCTGGSVDLSATTATAYRWSKNGTVIPGATSQIYNATTSGSYTVEAGNGTCYSAASAPVTVTVNPLPSVPTVTTTLATCSASGTATISNYSATNTYAFLPSGPTVGAGGAISGMTAGTSYTVTANNGSCTSSASSSFNIGAMLPTPAAPTVTTTAATCSANGTAALSNYVSTNTYAFLPSGPTVGAGGAISGMTAGTSYTVTANNGSCTSSASSSFNIGAMLPTPAAPTVTTTAATCSANGTATVSNYSATNTYAFLPAGPTVGAGGAVSGMTAGTSYTVTANNGSCTSSASSSFAIGAMLTAPSAPTITTTVATCSANGTATVSNYVSTNTYAFLPAGPTVGAGGAISGMTAGTSYTVTANNGSCTSSASASFTIGAMLTAPSVPTVTTTAATCSTNGTATISNYVSTNTYAFLPSGPTVGAGGAVSGMAAGTSYTVTANNGSCTSSASASFAIGAMLTAPSAPTVTTTVATCSANGTATVSNYVSTNTYAFLP
ncbi:hypothetical protein DF947_21235 [Pedobacter paludis]|uniref:Ig-like domain-containing protein n=2 Tax=Pedobacter paludis TaxID=2203212 RepID=A0A317ET57_9SPHI|nr:hypothetical protein DF947_21235 [Pedobacter paludis]